MATGTELSALLNPYLHNDASLTASNKLTILTLGQKRIIRDAPTVLRRKAATLSLTDALGREYSLASDFYMMSGAGMWLKDPERQLDPIAANEFVEDNETAATTTRGAPFGYIILGYDESQETPAWRVLFDRDPDDSYTVYYWYHPMPAAVTADATPVVSSMGFDELLLWAAAMIHLEPRGTEGSMNAVQHYLANLESFRNYSPMQPAYTPRLRPDARRRGNQLGSHYPSWA